MGTSAFPGEDSVQECGWRSQPSRRLRSAQVCHRMKRDENRAGSSAYCLRTTGGPLTRFALKSTVTSTRSAILMKGMPLFIP